MAIQVQVRRGTTAEHSAFTGAAGELTYDTDLNRLVTHDGSTAGGHPHATKAYVDAELLNAAKAVDWGRKGADIAAASTLNLSTATGDLLDITGNTTITAITLAEGRSRVLRFTGTPTIQVGASLIGNGGGGNIAIQAGDMALVRGYAGGVVRLWVIRASGKAVVTTVTSADISAAALAALAFGPFTDIASGATTNLGSVATIGVRITGTTTITSFGSGANLIRVGKLAAALTLTHNAASLILPGGANITTAAGDCFVALSDASGNWTVVSYVRASGKAVVANTAAEIANTPAGNIAATTVQAAIDELDGEKVAKAGDTMTGNLTITGSGITTSSLTSTLGTSGAAAPSFELNRDAAGLTTADLIGRIAFRARNDAGTVVSGAQLRGRFGSYAAGAESSSLEILNPVSGTNAVRLRIGGGVFHPAVTGGDKGNNTINFGAVYDDNVLLTCMAMAETFARTGKFDDDDVAQWDALVPDQIIPAHIEEVPVYEEVEERRIIETAEDFRIVTARAQKPLTELVPVYAEDGITGIDAIEVPVTEKIEVPEQIIPRVHHTARLFKRMIDDGFDPRDPAAYIAKMRDEEALPGMPNRETWEHNSISSGEMLSRLWLATEMLALAFASLVERVAALEAA